MLSRTRLYVSAIVLSVGVAGCTPANFVQRIRPAPKCEVQVCLNPHIGSQRCDCRSAQQVERQLREAGFLSLK